MAINIENKNMKKEKIIAIEKILHIAKMKSIMKTSPFFYDWPEKMEI